MAQLIVRNLDEELVRRLKLRAAAHGRSTEEEHRQILRQALGPPSGASLKGALPDGARLSTVTVSRDRAGRWFVSILIDDPTTGSSIVMTSGMHRCDDAVRGRTSAGVGR